MRHARFPAAAAVFGLVVALVAPGAAADPRSERDEARSRRAQVAEQLDALEASDQELEEAVSALDANIVVQSAKVTTARQAAEAAEVELAEAVRRLEATRAEIAELRSIVIDRAVAAYIHPGSQRLDELVASDDLLEVARKHAMLAHVAGNDNDVLDQLAAAEEDELHARAAAEDATANAAARRDEAERRLVELNGARAEQARLRQALDVRIAEFQAEVDALAAQESELTRVIAAQEADARAQAARNAAAAAGRGTSGAASRGAASVAPSGPSASGLIWPTSGRVSSGFGQRWGRLHAGLDIAAPTGTPIHAAAAGTVIYSGTMSGYGNVVMIDHGSLTTVYAHQSRIAVGNGRFVAQGAVIGYVGSTGRSTGPHLHFETRVGGSPRNPAGYL